MADRGIGIIAYNDKERSAGAGGAGRIILFAGDRRLNAARLPAGRDVRRAS